MGFVILILIWIWSLVFDTPMSRILALCLDFESAKNIQVLLVLIWGLEGAGDSRRILIHIWSLVFDTPMFQILTLYLDFEGA